MKETLLKKRFGVPALLLIIMLLTAGAIAAYCFKSFKITGKAEEPLNFGGAGTQTIEFQGESGYITVTATNASSRQAYGIFVDTDVVSGNVKSVEYSEENLFVTESTLAEDFNDDGDMIDATYNISPTTTSGTPEGYDITVTAYSDSNAAPSKTEVSVTFIRKPEYKL